MLGVIFPICPRTDRTVWTARLVRLVELQAAVVTNVLACRSWLNGLLWQEERWLMLVSVNGRRARNNSEWTLLRNAVIELRMA